MADSVSGGVEPSVDAKIKIEKIEGEMKGYKELRNKCGLFKKCKDRVEGWDEGEGGDEDEEEEAEE
jgi:hypothetical protein